MCETLHHLLPRHIKISRIFPRLSTPEKSQLWENQSKWRAFSTTPSKSLAPPRACNPLECKARRVKRGCCATKSPKAPPPAGGTATWDPGFLGAPPTRGEAEVCLLWRLFSGQVSNWGCFVETCWNNFRDAKITKCVLLFWKRFSPVCSSTLT